MNKYFAVAASLALLGGGIESAPADGIVASTIKCKDGTEVYLASACDSHGGATKAIVPATPIDASKKPTKTASAAKAKSPTTANSSTSSKPAKSAKKTAAHATKTPTAKCIDGAFYYSTERRGACAKHGGIDKWYGW